MESNNTSKNLRIENIYMAIIGIIFFINIISPYIFAMKPAFNFFIYLGWIILFLGFILVVFSIMTLRKRGIKCLIENGVYSIVRHPLYVGGMVMFFSHIFFFQHWFFILDSFIAIWIIYQIILWEEKELLNKYPHKYGEYSKRVPRINFISGAFKQLFQKS